MYRTVALGLIYYWSLYSSLTYNIYTVDKTCATMKFHTETEEAVRSIVDKAVAANEDTIPGATVVVVAKDGSMPVVHSSGRVGLSSDEKMTPDNIFWIASCTKMLTGLCCMQLVERGVMKLDDGDHLEQLCPELKDVKVLQENGDLVPKNKQITLRMLLTHTSGFGYSFFNTKLRDWGFPAGVDEFSGDFRDMNQPLIAQPGEKWEYGVCILSWFLSCICR